MKFDLAVILNSSTIELSLRDCVLHFGGRMLCSDHATPTENEKLWSKGIAMHVYSVSVYYV